jgi:MFS family permease
MAAVGLFVPIYLYEYFDNAIAPVLLTFALFSILVAFLTPFAAKLSTHIGLKHSMLLSVPFLVLYLFSLIQLPAHPLFLAGVILGYGLATALYWTSFHTDFARASCIERQGKNIGGFRAVVILAAILGPFFGALIISQFGFTVLFLIAILVEALALLPLFFSPDIHEPYDFHFGRELKSAFAHKRLRTIFTFFGEGIDTKLSLYVWPIFLFTALSGYVAVGGIATGSLLVALILGLFIGRFVDSRGRVGPFRLAVIVNALAWIGRAFAVGEFFIFMADSFYKIATNVLQVPYMALVYNHAEEKGTSLEHYIVIREIVLNIGGATALLLGVFYFQHFASIQAFMLFGSPAVLMMLVYSHGKR